MYFHFEWSSVILCLNAHELLAFVYIFVECTLPRQSPVANRVLHMRQRKLIDVIDRHVMIFLTTYFTTTPMADVNFTSLVTSLITCHHCVSFTVALVICKLQRIYVTSGAASVYFDDADNATCKSRVGLPYSVLPGRLVAEWTIFGFGCERTSGNRTFTTVRLFGWRTNRTVQYNHEIRICIALLWRHGIVYCITN